MEPRKEVLLSESEVRKVSRISHGILSSCLGGGGRGGSDRVRMPRVIRASSLCILAGVGNEKEGEKAF